MRAVPDRELAFAKTDRHRSVRTRDPWEVEFALARDGDELRTLLDDEATVAAIGVD